VRAGVDPAARLIFLSAMTWAIRFYVATMRLRQKANGSGSSARNPRKLAGDLARPELGAATCVNVGGVVRMELFALESSGAYLKSIALRVIGYWLRRREGLTGLQAGVLFGAQDAGFYPLLPKL
jgi:hypothetical protein